MKSAIPIIIPVYNTSPTTLYTTVSYLHKHTGNPIIVVNDGSKREDTNGVLELIEKNGYAKVLRKENGGKIDALHYGLEHIIQEYNPKCVFIQDDDVIPVPNNGKGLDEILKENCERLNEDFPVMVYPTANQRYLPENVLKEIKEDIKSFHKSFESKRKEDNLDNLLRKNFLDYIQHVEHTVVTSNARKAAGEGIYVNGTASLWRTEDLKRVLKNHSGKHAGDDYEMTFLVRKDGKGILFSEDLILYPELINDPKKFIKQRTYWQYGGYRVCLEDPKNCFNNPLHASYFLIGPLLYAALLPIPPLRTALTISYPSLIASQYLISKRNLREKVFDKFKDTVKLFGGIYIALPFYISSLFVNNDPLSHILQITGALAGYLYTIYLLYKNNINNENLRLELKDLFVYSLYVPLYTLVFTSLGAVKYIKEKAKGGQRTYKISH
ncbi:MAG: hypothetical protein BXU00_02355 [Candidatus Nanoclepta minutus]|uniref:Glycosyltransferase 2-like domain-containing protein n=1 Tax=Candidatus Nanoclepta minutus TaxID=1940235 RepID=A0A397WMP7_9ARCH|nr:MAG: hypothetical protein BXU00_02355 [Candidatus Nanoclepta minutus]